MPDGALQSNYDSLELFFTQFREHRQRQDFASSPLRMGEVAGFVAQVSISLLQVNRDRIVDASLNSLVPECSLQKVTFRVAHGVDMVDMASVRHGCWRFNPGVFEELVVPGCVSPPGFGPGVQMAELDAQDGPLEALHAIVEALQFVVVFLRGAPVAEHAEGTVIVRAICRDQPSFAARPRFLPG